MCRVSSVFFKVKRWVHTCTYVGRGFAADTINIGGF